MRQTDYGYNQPLGLPGGIFDLSSKSIVTRTVDPNCYVKAGMGLVVGATAGETVKLPATGATAATFEGVYVHGSKQVEYQMNGTVSTGEGSVVGVMNKGKIWALIASTATTTYGKGVALILTGDNAGKFTDADDADETSKVALTNVVFLGSERTDAENGIAVIEMK